MPRDLKHFEFLFEYLQDAHRFQMERLDKLRERISFVSGFLLLLGTGFSSMLMNYQVAFEEHARRDWFFVIFLSGAAVLLIIASVYTAVCLLPQYRYASPRPASDVLKQAKAWESFNENPAVADKRDIALQLKSELCELYAKAADFNQPLITKRNDMLVIAMRMAFLSALFAAVPATCVVISKYSDDVAPTKVQILDSVKVNLK